jgi:hypothetical protein
VAAGIAVVAAVAAAVIVLEDSAAHKAAAPQARTSARAHPPTQASAPVVRRLLIGQLRAGDCLQGPPDVNAAKRWPYIVTAVPCTETHIAEVYFYSAHYWAKDMAFPGHAKLVHQASTECRKIFRSYDGMPLSQSQLTFTDVSPRNRANWSSGDRLLLCSAYHWTPWYKRGQVMYWSIKGSDL